MTHLFISHSTRDGAAVAHHLARALESAGHRCWIAPRDVKPGVPYPGQIVAAIRDCAGLVLVVTPAANESPDVLQEVQLAGQHRKTLAPVVVDRTAPSDDLHYYLGVRHQIPWTDETRTTRELLRSFPAQAAETRLPVGEPVRAYSGQVESIAPAGVADDPRYDVVMLAPGSRWIEAAMIVREFSGLKSLKEAESLVESVPPIRLAPGLTYLSAFQLVSQLRAIGATMMDPVKAKD